MENFSQKGRINNGRLYEIAQEVSGGELEADLRISGVLVKIRR